MRTRQDYIKILQRNGNKLREDFGVTSLRIFGSVARNEHHDGSDLDICVEMPPKMSLVLSLNRFLEELLQTSVDVIRLHSHLNPFLKDEIEHDGIYVLQ